MAWRERLGHHVLMVGRKAMQGRHRRSEVGGQRSGVKSASAKSSEDAQPSGQVPDVADNEGPPDDSWIIGSMDEDVVIGSPGDSFETAKAIPAEVITQVPKPAVVRLPAIGSSAGAGQPAVVLLDLAALVPRLFCGRVPGDPWNHTRNPVGSRLPGGGERAGSPCGLVPVGRNDRRDGRRDWR